MGTGAPIKARALLAGDDAFGNISTDTLSLDFSFTHIAACVDAFRGSRIRTRSKAAHEVSRRDAETQSRFLASAGLSP